MFKGEKSETSVWAALGQLWVSSQLALALAEHVLLTCWRGSQALGTNEGWDEAERGRPRREDRGAKQPICCNELGWTRGVQNANTHHLAQLKES